MNFILIILTLIPLGLVAKSKESPNLKVNEAKLRSKSIENVSYNLQLEIEANSNSFKGIAEVEFEYKKNNSSLFLDFLEGKITALKLNEEPIAIKQRRHRLYLPLKSLKKRNKLTIHYQQEFSNDGTGLYRFLDPEDQKVYLYTQFETFHANHMFPCFDQPDLKAFFNLEVTVPKSWSVISYAKENRIQRKAEKNVWTFPKSKKMSTYLMSLHAGPYHKWESSYRGTPLRLFARETMKEFVDVSNWFRITKAGLRFFNNYFDYKYPFGKYDQIIVPNFNAGAMENIGAVTFTERLLNRGEQTKEQKERIIGIILHEMAHMWFGNLVTMDWWNGLWLNESFATYMATLAAHETGLNPGAWLRFARDKNWAYTEDQMITTHPIETPVKDTNSAFANFDGITYQKGASSLKQLSFFIGPESFKRGLQKYFKKYQYANTTINDFLGSLGKAANQDLSVWAEKWLRKAGLDELETKLTCQDEKIYKLGFSLVPPKEKVLRPHKTIVGLYYKTDSELELSEQIPLTYQKEETYLSQVKGKKCPDLVFANVSDHDYIKLSLDPQSIKTLVADLAKVQDDFTRLILWSTLYEMLKDQRISIYQYIDMVRNHLKSEMNPKIIYTVSRNFYHYGEAITYLPATTPEELNKRKTILKGLEQFFYGQIKNKELSKDARYQWLEVLSYTFTSPSMQSEVVQLLKSKKDLFGLTIDQDRRWILLQGLAATDNENLSSLLAEEKKNDSSERGIQSALKVQASIPSIKNKKDLINLTLTNKDMSFSRIRYIYRNLFPKGHESLKKELQSVFEEKLAFVLKNKPLNFSEDFITYLAPAYCEKPSVNSLDKIIRKYRKSNSSALKALLMVQDANKRCLRVRDKARQ